MSVNPKTPDNLPKGLAITSPSLSGEKRGTGVITGTPLQDSISRVLLRVETNYGTAEEYVTVKTKPPYEPSFEEETKPISAKTGEDIDIQLTGTNMVPTADYTVRDVRWEADNLPEGVTLNPVTGRLTGRPVTGGNSTTVITCRNQSGIATQVIQWTLKNPLPPTITAYKTYMWDGGTARPSNLF